MLKKITKFAALIVNSSNSTKFSLIMKKILTVLALLVVFASTSFAQIGARIGMDFANYREDWKDSYKPIVGLHLGLVYNLELANVLSLQPGVFYVQRNYKMDVTDYKIQSHYLEVPIVLKYNLELTNDITIDPHVGPYFGFGFAGKCKENKDYKVFKKVEKGGMGVANFDMGIQMGAGVMFFNAAYVGFDYELGFRDLTDYTVAAKAVDVKNGMFMITFGVYLPD